MAKKHASVESVIAVLQDGQRVFVHGGAATPNHFLNALSADTRLKSLELIHLHTEGPARYCDLQKFRIVNLFVGSNLRKSIDYDRSDYLPCFLSEIPALFRTGKRVLDVAVLHLSPPDQHGYCTLGTSVDVAKAASESAKLIIAQINPRVPRVHGDGFIHMDEIDHYFEVDEPLPSIQSKEPSPVERAIGKNCAQIVDDGACIQVGIGAIPNAVLAELKGHRHLGIHSEMWSDGALELIQCGAVDNSQKKIHPGKTVASFVMGTKAVYDFIHDNPSAALLGADYVNNPSNILRNSKVTAINSAVEIDLTGQVCADSIGHKIISGVGGQVDFLRGASLSPGGKPILAITSRTPKGQTRIVPELKVGAGVVTTRAHVHYVVTEYGVINVAGMTLNERAHALIGIAHPDDRENLSREWRTIQKRGVGV